MRVCVELQFGGKELREEEQTAESIKSQMSVKEWEKVFEMSQDKNLYHNLCTSLFPTIHGNVTIMNLYRTTTCAPASSLPYMVI